MEENIEELTLLLMYLTSWKKEGYTYNENENKLSNELLINTWKGYSFKAINGLTDKGYLFPSKYKEKVVELTKDGENQAKKLIEKYLK